MPTFAVKLLVSTGLGVSSHLGIFIRGEWHTRAGLLLRLYLLLFILVSILEYGCHVNGLTQTLLNSLSISICYNVGLFSSITIYRIFFHRLRCYPGPWLASVSKFWHVYQCHKAPNYLVLDKLHREYGDYVRTGKPWYSSARSKHRGPSTILKSPSSSSNAGPNELTIFDPEIVPAMLRGHNDFTKAAWYDFLNPLVALNATRDKDFHDRRRRIWDRAFTTKGTLSLKYSNLDAMANHLLLALQNYEERVRGYGKQLQSRIMGLVDQPVNMTLWFSWFSFDIMGDFAFAKTFSMLQSAEWHEAIVMLRSGMSIISYVTPVPWLAHIAFSVPILRVVRDWNFMVKWCGQRMSERLKVHIIRLSELQQSSLKSSLTQIMFRSHQRSAMFVPSTETR